MAKQDAVGRRASRLCSNAKYRAKMKGIPCTITREWVEMELRKNKCAASGLPFDLDPHPHRRRNGFSPSLDRINPMGGYTPENTQLVCTAINVMRAELSTQEHLLLCMAVLRKHGLSS